MAVFIGREAVHARDNGKLDMKSPKLLMKWSKVLTPVSHSLRTHPRFPNALGRVAGDICLAYSAG
jgi:hypothetical protein